MNRSVPHHRRHLCEMTGRPTIGSDEARVHQPLQFSWVRKTRSSRSPNRQEQPDRSRRARHACDELSAGGPMRTVMATMAVVSAVGLYSFGGVTMAQGGLTGAAKNVVLVHGAFADDSSWSKIVPLLKAKGLRVTTAGNPLTSFADDVAATKRAIAAQDGPTVLVGHSYGGVVITEAGNDPKVVSLVYVAAFAPDAGQSIGEISQAFAKPAGADQLQPQSGGFLLLSQKGVEEDFAQDLTPAEKARLVAAQPKTSGAIFEAEPTAAAWRANPAWYVVASNDRMIDPEQERSMAKQIKAKATVLPSSHVAMLSHPTDVAKVIEDAAANRHRP